MKRTTMRKMLKIFAISIAVVIAVIGVVALSLWIVWSNSLPKWHPFEEGLFVGEDHQKDGNTYAKLTVRAISEEEYVCANGLNVVKDVSKNRRADYFAFEIWLSEDNETYWQWNIIGLFAQTNENPKQKYYCVEKNKDYAILLFIVQNDDGAIAYDLSLCWRASSEAEQQDKFFRGTLIKEVQHEQEC